MHRRWIRHVRRRLGVTGGSPLMPIVSASAGNQPGLACERMPGVEVREVM